MFVAINWTIRSGGQSAQVLLNSFLTGIFTGTFLPVFYIEKDQLKHLCGSNINYLFSCNYNNQNGTLGTEKGVSNLSK